MKIGKRLLYTNGRGNYHPYGTMIRESSRKTLRTTKGGVSKESAKQDLKSLSHHSYNGTRKGLNSKIRHMLKKEINNELNNI